VEAARAATEASDWPVAVGRWQAVLDGGADSEETHLRLGEALLNARRFAEAEEVCARAWLRYPGNLWIGRNRALSAMWQRHWSTAIERFREVGRLHRHDALEADLAECLLAIGQRQEADLVVSEALENFPESQWLLRVRGLMGLPSDA
jgi:tetratricopeptide (TPR) repeat protein